MLFVDRPSTPFLRSNQRRLYFSLAAYVLMKALRGPELKGTELARAHCSRVLANPLEVRALIRVTFPMAHVSSAGFYAYTERWARVYR